MSNTEIMLMQVPFDDDDDPESTAEADAFAMYGDTLVEWRAPRPVVVIGTAADKPVARYLDDLSDDPAVWAPGVQGEMVPNDPDTFMPIQLSDVDDFEIGLTRTYPTVAEWMASEVDPSVPTD